METPPNAEWLLSIGDDQVDVLLTCHLAEQDPWVVPAVIDAPPPVEAFAFAAAQLRRSGVWTLT